MPPSAAIPAPRRVCIIKPSSLGDVVHAFPTLQALRSLWPEAHFSWVIAPGLRELVEGHPLIDEVIPFHRGAVRQGFKGWAQLGRFFLDLKRRRFDVAIDLQGLLRSGLMTGATRAPARIGPGDAREGARHFYTHPIAVDPSRAHAVDRLLGIAEALGADISSPGFPLALGDEDRAWAEERMGGLPRPRIAFNLGARWETKRWSPEHFAELAARAAREGAGIVAVGAPEDRPLVDRFLALLPAGTPVADFCGKTGLRKLAGVSAAVDLFVSNDTGPLHLAAATGTPVLGIYTCTDAGKTGPYGPRAETASTSVACAASRLRTCSRMDCMRELTAAKVWPTLARQLDGAGTRVRSPLWYPDGPEIIARPHGIPIDHAADRLRP